MQIIRGQTPTKAENTIVTLFGNGTRDERILETTAQKLDPEQEPKALLIPQTPRRTGLESTIDTLSTLISLRIITKTYTIIIDREHIQNQEQIKQTLEEHGFQIKQLKNITENLYKITCTKGPKEIDIYLTLIGLSPKGNIEEHLAKLINLTHNQNIEPTKEAINKWLKEHNETIENLIRRANHTQLKNALTPLYNLIKILRQDP